MTCPFHNEKVCAVTAHREGCEGDELFCVFKKTQDEAREEFENFMDLPNNPELDYGLKELAGKLGVSTAHLIRTVADRYNRECLEEDIKGYLSETLDVGFDDEEIAKIADIVEHDQDCNIALNDAIDAAYHKYHRLMAEGGVN